MSSVPAVIGAVREIRRFPVKSMAGEALEAAELGWHGIAGDRRYAFVRTGNTSRFPWLTGRELSEMLLYRPRLADPARPRDCAVEVRTPEERTYGIDDPCLAEELAGKAGEPVNLVQLSRGCFDSMPVSVLASASGARLDARFGRAVSLVRFRCNILVETDPAADEPRWLGSMLAVGDDGPLIRIDRPIERCAMTTIDPETAARDPAVMRVLAEDFGNVFGVYGSIARPGRIACGDTVRLISERL